MSQPIYNTPPLAGRPPFATDEPDSIYEQRQPAPRVRQAPPPDPNERTSAYNMYDSYMDSSNEKNMDALMDTMLNDDLDNPFDDKKGIATPPSPRQKQYNQQPIPLAAPRPGYAAPISALKLAPPSPVATPGGRQPASPQTPTFPKPFTLMNGPPSPRGVPSAPHPLQPSMTPITPAFVRPNSPGSRDVKFASSGPILRGQTEDSLLPKRGEKGDDFWRRFSMVAKEENQKPVSAKKSAWLMKTENGTSRLSRWVWVIGMLVLICIAGAIAIGVYVNRNNTSHNAPKAIGGSADEKLSSESSSIAAAATSTTSLHVHPTNTVARRAPAAEPTVTAILAYADLGAPQPARVPHSHRRSHVNRTIH